MRQKGSDPLERRLRHHRSRGIRSPKWFSFNEIRQTQQALQDQVDSLSGVVARQASVIRSLANLAGVPVPR